MKIFLAVCLVACYVAAEDLRAILRSPKATLNLYSNYKAKEHLAFSSTEDRMRFRVFRSNAEFVAAANEEESSAEFALNFFSALTAEEKQQYLGLNVTGHQAHEPRLSTNLAVPEKTLWTNTGDVTAVKNQGRCGSCWTFGAVGGLETRYKAVSGVLRNFAEQEYLDCVYEGERNGCNGGWPDDSYTYSKNNGGRLASTADYPYAATDGTCRGSSKPDSMIAAKITGYVEVGSTEQDNIAALAEGSLSVAFEVTNYFQQYSRGIMKDTTCTGRPNHAVTAVGYTASFVLVKNSWGSGWGDSGFVKFARNYHNCGLFSYSSYPRLSSTGSSDSGSADAATPYRPDEDDTIPTADPNCQDLATGCKSYHCKYQSLIKYCEKTCGECGNDDGDCAAGTIRCSDGICRHEHMCPH